MNDAVDDLRQQIEAEIASTDSGSLGYENLLLIQRESPVNSAVNTNVLQLSVPGSSEYQIIKNFYPLHDDARFGNVSRVG